MPTPAHVLITGASSGIGAALAVAYAQTGMTLSLTGRDATRLENIAALTRAKGAGVRMATGDVCDQAFMKDWVESSFSAQPVDLVIANAGISPGLKHGEETPQDVTKVFATNLQGVLNTIAPVIPLMKNAGRGQIALMASLAGFRGFSGGASYCASKAAVRVYGEGLRGDLIPYGVSVNVICPGFIATPMTDTNPFPMPFKMDAAEAAQIIVRGLAKDLPRIAFPFGTYALVRIAAALPQDTINRLTTFLRGSKS